MTLVVEQEHLYPTQFQHYLTRNVTYILGLVQQASPVLEADLRAQALHTLSYALQAPTIWAVTRQLFITLAPKMEQAGQREHWIPYLQEALDRSIAQGDGTAAGECHLQLAILYRLLSQFDTAHAHLQAALEHFTAMGAGRDQARVLNELAWLEHLQHHYETASTHAQAALDLLPTNDEERGMSYRVQGMIALDQGRWTEGEINHRRALIIFEQHNAQRRIAWSLQNLANALREQQKYREAIEYYQQAITLLSQLYDDYNLAIVYVNLGTVYYLLKECNIAVQWFMTSLNLTAHVNNKSLMARIYTSLGIVYLEQGNDKFAEINFGASVQLFNELRDFPLKLNAMDGLAMVYLMQHNYAKAINILQEAQTDLPKIIDAPNYTYLFQSLNKHLEEAQRGGMSNCG